MLRKDAIRPVAASTADPAEIARFNAVADEWWNPKGAFKVVHAFNEARVSHLRSRLPTLAGRDPRAEQPLTGLKLLDVGCGPGLVAEPLSRLGAETFGIDAAERNVRIAQRHATATGASVLYRNLRPEQCEPEAGAYDIVLALEVVEHVADLDAFLDAVARLVAPGGLLVVGTLNRTVASFVKAIVGAEYVLRWLPRGTHDWRKFVKPDELAHTLERSGFEVVERCGVNLNLFNGRWSIGKNVDSLYLQIHRKRATGEVDS